MAIFESNINFVRKRIPVMEKKELAQKIRTNNLEILL